MISIVRAAAALMAAALLFTSAPALAQTGNPTITGQVLDERSALPIAGAAIVVSRAGTQVAHATTNDQGRYTISGTPAGVYDITISCNGYSPAVNNDIAIATGVSNVIVNVTLQTAQTASRNGLTQIGHTSTSANPLIAATTISQEITVENLTRTGQIRLGDQLATLPAVNFQTSSSVGDDATVNLRGFGSSETAMLLDGHPVGPLGVGGGSFNFALGPSFGLSGVDVTYGSGAQGLYGNDTVGGAINYITLSPTGRPQFSFQQQAGGFGISSTGVTATGQLNRLGYVFAAGRLGEYGDFHPAVNPQSARPNNVSSSSANPNGACIGQPDPNNPGSTLPEVSACNLALNSYAYSQNTEQSIALGKLVYALSRNTKATFSAYDAVQWSDSTGNGDNDYLPLSTRLSQIARTTPSPSCPQNGAPEYLVSTDPLAGSTACYTAQQWAAASYGPDGGGAGRQRSTRMGDYHLRLTTTAGINNIIVDGYLNNYVYQKDSSLAGGIDPNGLKLGTPTFANFYNTKGFLLSDELILGKHDIAFGYNLWHQLQTGNENDIAGIVQNPTGFFGEGGAFVRDDYHFSDNISFFVNAWLKRSSVTQRTTFDPRATLQFRPSRNDVLQFTYGRSDGAPSPALKLIGTPVASDPGASLTSVSCNGFNDVTSAGNPNLQSEAANDYEIGYGHRFKGDSNIQLNLYQTNLTNQLFGASEPIGQFGAGNIIFAPGALTTYIGKFQNQCGLNLNNQTVLQYLSVGTKFNAAQARARGVELSGRARLNRTVFLDYSYDIESDTQQSITDNILLNNPSVVNNAQLQGIPLASGQHLGRRRTRSVGVPDRQLLRRAEQWVEPAVVLAQQRVPEPLLQQRARGRDTRRHEHLQQRVAGLRLFGVGYDSNHQSGRSRCRLDAARQ